MRSPASGCLGVLTSGAGLPIRPSPQDRARLSSGSGAPGSLRRLTGPSRLFRKWGGGLEQGHLPTTFWVCPPPSPHQLSPRAAGSIGQGLGSTSGTTFLLPGSVAPSVGGAGAGACGAAATAAEVTAHLQRRGWQGSRWPRVACVCTRVPMRACVCTAVPSPGSPVEGRKGHLGPGAPPRLV